MWHVQLIRPFQFPEQFAEAGNCDEHELEQQAGRAPTRRPSIRDDVRPQRDPEPAAGTDQIGGILPVGSVRSEAGHGGDQARAGHCPAGQRGNRGVEGVRRSAGGAHASQETETSGAGLFPPQNTHGVCVELSLKLSTGTDGLSVLLHPGGSTGNVAVRIQYGGDKRAPKQHRVLHEGRVQIAI